MSLDSELLAEMRQLVQLDDQNLEQVYGQVEDFFFKWAGVEDIDPNSRSDFFDARKHAFLEKFFQQPIDFEITRLGHTSGLLQSWADLTNHFTSRLAAQSFMRELFSESSYNINSDSLETEASLSDLLEQIQNNLPEATIDAARYWSYGIGVLDAHEDRFNLSENEYDNTLKTALSSDLSEYLPALRNPVFGRESNDQFRLMVNSQGFLDGDSGNDRLIGGLKEDILNGGAGNDTLNGNAGEDYLDGGSGIDTLIYPGTDAEVGVTVNLATNSAAGGHAEGDTISGFENLEGSPFADNLIGDEQDNILRGYDGADSLDGGTGNDDLFGGSGADTLNGGNGDDILKGKAGADLLTGGSGINTFTWDNLTHSLLNNFDHITDLKIGSDIIDAPTAVTTSEIAHLDAVTSLEEVDIQVVLEPESFGANIAATFTLNEQTFLAINDSEAGFSAENDAIIEITGFNGNLTDLAII